MYIYIPSRNQIALFIRIHYLKQKTEKKTTKYSDVSRLILIN